MKLAIIEGEEEHTELLTRYVKAWGRDRNIPVVITSFPSAESFLLTWESSRDFDVLFADIQTEQNEFLEMARQIRKKDLKITIIFTTSIANLTEEKCGIKAMHYLLKPIDQEKMIQCMDRISKKSGNEKFLLVQTGSGTMKLALDKIMYIEAQGHGCIIEFCPQPGRTFQLESAESISALETRLDKRNFIRCHRSYIVRIDKIRHIRRAWIEMQNGSKIGVSRRLYSDVSQMFARRSHRTRAKINNR